MTFGRSPRRSRPRFCFRRATELPAPSASAARRALSVRSSTGLFTDPDGSMASGSANPSAMATTDELMRFVIHEIDTHMPRLTSGPDYLPRQMAAAALARARMLWAALDAVQAAGQAVVGGLLSRAIWECWVVGLFVLFKGDNGYEHLAGAYDRANGLITDRWPDDETRPELRRLDYSKQKLNYEMMATEVTRLLAERGGQVMTLSYDGLYRSWSTLAAHATFGSLMLFVEDTGSYLKLGPGRLPLPAEVDLQVTSTFLGHLAWFVLREFSIDGTKLIDAVEQLHVRQLADDPDT